MNVIATSLGIDTVILRPAANDLEHFYRALCEEVPPERVTELRALRKKWCDNGGCGDLPENLLDKDVPLAGCDQDPAECDTLPCHGPPGENAKGGYRLKARAFMLTFNALTIVASPEMWASFQQWVEDRKVKYKATY